jgi:haloacetate dehalogenase
MCVPPAAVWRPIDMAIPITHHRVVANGIKLHYVEAGSGPAVVLLHGFPETGYAWRHQIPPLAERYRVIVPDLRGYGATEKAPTGYDKRTMANDIRALMAALGINKAAIVGNDRGDLVTVPIAQSSHLPHEEQPAAVTKALLAFLEPWKG